MRYTRPSKHINIHTFIYTLPPYAQFEIIMAALSTPGTRWVFVKTSHVTCTHRKDESDLADRRRSTRVNVYVFLLLLNPLILYFFKFVRSNMWLNIILVFFMIFALFMRRWNVQGNKNNISLQTTVTDRVKYQMIVFVLSAKRLQSLPAAFQSSASTYGQVVYGIFFHRSLNVMQRCQLGGFSTKRGGVRILVSMIKRNISAFFLVKANRIRNPSPSHYHRKI